MKKKLQGGFWEKNVILFLASQNISIFGSTLVQYAIMWYITLETKSGIMMTLSIVCATIPTFIISPFAGVWADRYNRKMIMICADAFIAVSTLILAILFIMGYDSIKLLFVITAIRSFGGGIQSPAVGAFLPQIVKPEKLMKVNATNGSLMSIVTMISPILGGVLLSVASIEAIFLVDVVTAGLAIIVLFFFLHVPPHKKAKEKQTIGYFTDMKQGLLYIKNHPFIMKYFMFLAIFFILAAPVAFLTPLQVARSFGSDVWRLTVLEIVFSLGMALGGLIMAVWGGYKNKIYTMTLSSLLIGATTAALGVTPFFWLYIFFMGLSGVAMPIFNTPATVLLQEKVEEDYLGRVFGVLTMIATTMMPLGMVIFGPLSDIIKIEWILLVTGVLLFIMGFFLLTNKTLIEAGK